jgi:hypothetical protein
MRVKGFALASVLALTLLPVPAWADGFVTPFLGVNFGGATGTTLNTSLNDSSKLNYGVGFWYMSHGILGLEGEYGNSPNFYGSGTVFEDSSVQTFMGNVVLGIPFGGQGAGLRPYAVGGVGLIRQHLTGQAGLGDISSNNAAWDLGGGIMGMFSSHVGVQGDIRYFRNFNANSSTSGISLAQGNFNFARAAVGIAFRF